MKTSIIPIFIPHSGCPYRCVFCNQWKITGHHGIPTGEDVAAQIEAYVRHTTEKRHWEVAFYGGSFTAIPVALQEELLRPAYDALQAGSVHAIRCSTRPDCITTPILHRLRAYGMQTVELGVQSMDDAVLQAAKRGHTSQDVENATYLLREGDFIVGHQLMPGLPQETWQSMKTTTQAICSLQPDIARIYPVVVIANTELADMYRRGTYKALSIHEGVQRSAYMKQAFVEAGIQVIRTGLQATADLDDGIQVLGGAYTPAMGELVDTKRYQRKLFSLLDTLHDDVTILYHRRDTSRLRGYHNVTVKRAALRYAMALSWKESADVPMGTIIVKSGTHEYPISMNTP